MGFILYKRGRGMWQGYKVGVFLFFTCERESLCEGGWGVFLGNCVRERE